MLDFLFKTKRYEQRLDRLYPKLKNNRRCACCGRPAEHVHHIIPRANTLLRWDIKNLIPLCAECHAKVHNRKQELIISSPRRTYLEIRKNYDFKQYLLRHNLTKEDFYKQKEKELKGAIR